MKVKTTSAVRLWRPLVGRFTVILISPSPILISTDGESQKKIYSQHKVRTSIQDRTLDSMFPVSNPSHSKGEGGDVESPPTMLQSREIKESDCNLTSVQNLRDSIVKGKHFRKGSFYWLASIYDKRHQTSRKSWRNISLLASSVLIVVYLYYNIRQSCIL
jgi:hypothetical protein